MRVYDGASLMTLVISTECANPPTLVGGSLVLRSKLRGIRPVEIKSPRHSRNLLSGI